MSNQFETILYQYDDSYNKRIGITILLFSGWGLLTFQIDPFLISFLASTSIMLLLTSYLMLFINRVSYDSQSSKEMIFRIRKILSFIIILSILAIYFLPIDLLIRINDPLHLIKVVFLDRSDRFFFLFISFIFQLVSIGFYIVIFSINKQVEWRLEENGLNIYFSSPFYTTTKVIPLQNAVKIEYGIPSTYHSVKNNTQIVRIYYNEPISKKILFFEYTVSMQVYQVGLENTDPHLILYGFREIFKKYKILDKDKEITFTLDSQHRYNSPRYAHISTNKTVSLEELLRNKPRGEYENIIQRINTEAELAVKKKYCVSSISIGIISVLSGLAMAFVFVYILLNSVGIEFAVFNVVPDKIRGVMLIMPLYYSLLILYFGYNTIMRVLTQWKGTIQIETTSMHGPSADNRSGITMIATIYATWRGRKVPVYTIPMTMLQENQFYSVQRRARKEVAGSKNPIYMNTGIVTWKI